MSVTEEQRGGEGRDVVLPEGRTTLSRIASDAEVSPSTVSKVLHGRAGVSTATRERVEEALRAHGYGRSRPGRAALLVELVMSTLDHAWGIEIVRGVERAAREAGLSVVLTESGDRHSPGPEWIDGVVQRHPAGVVLLFSDLGLEQRRRLRTRGIPFVVVDPAGDPAPDVASVGSTNWAGGVLATRHLVELGHRRIAAISGPDDMMCSRARVAGYRSALEEAGLPILPEYVVHGDFLREGGMAAAARLLALPERPTAIFAGSDLMAFGVYEAARAAGLSVPGDLSVVGYDDIQIAAWAGPPLTTVHQPLAEMGEQATRIALGTPAIVAPSVGRRVDLVTSLVVRESTAAPKTER